MKIWTLIFVAIVLMGVSCVNGAPESTCKEFVASLTKKQLGGISGCSKSMKFKNPKEKSAKMNCILKCVLIKENLLNADGQFVDGAQYDKMIDEFVPSNLVDKAVPKFTACKDKVAGTLDNAEEFCKSYDPLIKCMLDVIGTLCK